MLLVYLSRWLNCYLFLGSPNEMLCARIYRECWPNHYTLVIDCVFFWHAHHCQQCYQLEVDYAKSHQVSDPETESKTSPAASLSGRLAGLSQDLHATLQQEEGMTIPIESCKSDMERFGLTTCGNCNHLLHQDEAIVKLFYTGGMQETEHFCSEKCKYDWHLSRLNTLGM